MKQKLTLLLIGVGITFITLAQPHEAFKYQAAVRDAAGNLITNQTVKFRLSIIDSYEAGPILYQETHLEATNDFGMVTLTVGEGAPVIGYAFEDVDWSNNFKFLKVEIDPAGGTNFINMGTSELLSVPYALYSERSMDSYWENNSNKIYYVPGNVGIGTNDPAYPFHLINSSGINWVAGIHNTSTSATSNGLVLRADGGDPFWVQNNSSTLFMIKNNGNVGIGTTNPNYKLDVNGGSNIAINATSTNNYAIYGKTAGSGTAGVLGEGSSAGNWGVYGYNGYGGVAVRGYSTGGWGGYFYGNMYVSGNTGIGTSTPDNKLVVKSSGSGDVLKILSNTDNTLAKFRHTGNNSGALYLYDGSNNNTIFLYGDGNSFINSGSFGLGTASPSNAKLQIEGTGTYDAILRMNNLETNGANFFMGSTNSAWGGGTNQNLFVMGHGAPASANIDLAITSTGHVGIGTTSPIAALSVVPSSGYAIYGLSTESSGVWGASVSNIGVFGQSTSGWAGYFSGNVNVTGALSKGAGSFVIDHPLDPENKLLRHNFVESPENLLIYRGKVKLDENGEAIVTMPDYFTALTMENEATVQLTPVGKSQSD